MKNIILTASVILLSFNLFSQNKPDDVLGIYWTDKKEGKVEISKMDNKYFGKILWRKEVRKDIENPDKSLRDRSVIGIVFLKDFVFDGDDQWEDGSVYSIDNGGTYSGKMWMEENGQILKMRGYMGLSLLGRTATLIRATE